MDEKRIRQQFLRKNPPTYTGMRRGRIARDWALEIERIFRELSIPDSHLRVELDVQTFTRDAVIWWEIAQRFYPTRRFIWRDFIRLFYRHHCTRRYQVVLKYNDLKRKHQEERVSRLREQRKKRGTVRRAT